MKIVVDAAFSVHQSTPLINSISLERERYEKLLSIITGTDMKVIALCMSDSGMPQTLANRMIIADELVNGLLKNNVSVENIFVDHLVQPASGNNTFGVELVNAIEKIVETFSGVRTAWGLSNISFGLPNFTKIMEAGGRLAGLSDDQIKEINAKYSFLQSLTIPAGYYPGQAEPLQTVGSFSFLLGPH